MKFDRFNDVWYAVFVTFETKIVFIFFNGIDNKISGFQWIQKISPKAFFHTPHPREKYTQFLFQN